MPEREIGETKQLEGFAKKLWLKHVQRYQPPESKIDTSFLTLPELMVTEDPKEVFGERSGFHVTSDYVLPLLMEDKPLLPPFLHEQAGIITHRKSALALGDVFLELFGINMASKKILLFGSPLIDPEQVLIEEHLAQHTGSGIGLDMYAGILLEEFEHGTDPYEPNYYNYITPTTLWVNIFKELAKNGGISPQFLSINEKVINDTLKMVSMWSGVRDGWFTRVRNILEGKEKCLPSLTINSMQDSFYLLDRIIPAYDSWVRTFRKSTQSVMSGHVAVIQYSMGKIIDRTMQDAGVFPVLNSDRDPQTINYFPSLTLGDVEKIYYDYSSPSQNVWFKSQGVDIEPIDSLPSSAFINGIRPSDIKFEQIDPSNPLCQTRYETDWPERKLRMIEDGKLIGSDKIQFRKKIK